MPIPEETVPMYLLLSFMPQNDKNKYIETIYGTITVYGISTLKENSFPMILVTVWSLWPQGSLLWIMTNMTSKSFWNILYLLKSLILLWTDCSTTLERILHVGHGKGDNLVKEAGENGLHVCGKDSRLLVLNIISHMRLIVATRD